MPSGCDPEERQAAVRPLRPAFSVIDHRHDCRDRHNVGMQKIHLPLDILGPRVDEWIAGRTAE
jgi:hypothetical protein